MKSKKIIQIKKVGKMIVYDISVPKNNNFILSNGILSHNSETRGIVDGSSDLFLMGRITSSRDKRELCLEENTKIKILGENEEIKSCKLKDLPSNFIGISYNLNKHKIEKNKIFKKYNNSKDCYKITFEDGTYVIATKEHKFYNYKNKIKKVGELNVMEKLVFIK